jgi:uncharacterized membrane protein YphA (DoxX/SURF4 family)
MHLAVREIMALFVTTKEHSMKNLWQWLTAPPTNGPAAILLLRLMTGGVFFWEGILKFVYTNQGIGRFTKLGIPFPVFSANFIGYLEIIGGLCIMLGLFTRIFSVLFIAEMFVAMLTTKISMYLGTSPLPLPSSPPQIGIWAVLHEIRSEYAQMFTCIFYSIVGPGILSLDARLRKTQEKIKVQPMQTNVVPIRDAKEKRPKLPPEMQA